MPEFMYKKQQCLLIDKADCVLEVGLDEELKQIIKICQHTGKPSQARLFSVSQTKKRLGKNFSGKKKGIACGS
jgi:superfamily II DNA/RNA helicase